MHEILQRIDEASHIVVIAHMNPDADSLGSASALYTHLLRLHKKVSFFCATKNLSQKFACIPWFEKIKESYPSSADLAIALDCGTLQRLGVDVECDLINIDHHQSNNFFGRYNLVDVSCISTTAVLYNFFEENNILINPKMATALYAGLLDDSKGFVGEGVDGTTFAVLNALIEHKAEYKSCNRSLRRYASLASLRLKGLMLQNMQLLHNARLCVFCVDIEDMKATGALGMDCESALDESLYLPTVSISLLFKENKDGSIKCSLRSQNGYDIAPIASLYNGGGHKNRAGFILDTSYTLQSAKEEIINLIEKEIYFEKK
jgi:bifunctional oligoribonuclease and PAP phosphatase NrnA